MYENRAAFFCNLLQVLCVISAQVFSASAASVRWDRGFTMYIVKGRLQVSSVGCCLRISASTSIAARSDGAT